MTTASCRTIRICRCFSTASAFDLSGTPDPEHVIEALFKKNGWGDMWRNGIFPYVHYHSQIHEGMGIARGRAKVRFGGDKGQELDIKQGDVVVLPAGTGHQCLWASPDLMVIGAYPPDGRYDLCRGSKAEHAKALQTIPQVPLPKTRSGLWREGSAAGVVAENVACARRGR